MFVVQGHSCVLNVLVAVTWRRVCGAPPAAASARSGALRARSRWRPASCARPRARSRTGGARPRPPCARAPPSPPAAAAWSSCRSPAAAPARCSWPGGRWAAAGPLSPADASDASGWRRTETRRSAWRSARWRRGSPSGWRWSWPSLYP